MIKPLTMQQMGKRSVVIERDFAAAIEHVWRAFTEPQLVQQWLTGPPGHTMPECEIDLRVGGQWRYKWLTPVEPMVAFGEFRLIEPLQKLIHTETFEAWPDATTLVTTSFTAGNKLTRVSMQADYPSDNVRDAVLTSGMDQGLEMSYANLDAFIGTL